MKWFVLLRLGNSRTNTYNSFAKLIVRGQTCICKYIISYVLDISKYFLFLEEKNVNSYRDITKEDLFSYLEYLDSNGYVYKLNIYFEEIKFSLKIST